MGIRQVNFRDKLLSTAPHSPRVIEPKSLQLNEYSYMNGRTGVEVKRETKITLNTSNVLEAAW
jgi:hypothetical protein